MELEELFSGNRGSKLGFGGVLFVQFFVLVFLNCVQIFQISFHLYASERN